MTEVNMNEEVKYDYEPDSVADALAWVQKINEDIHTIPITKEEIESGITSYTLTGDVAEVFADAH